MADCSEKRASFKSLSSIYFSIPATMPAYKSSNKGLQKASI